MSRVIYVNPRIVLVPRYKLTTFFLDLVLAMLTGGLWLLWPLFKFLRTGHR